ncbi:MAG: transposase [Chitinispirillaceae bacterium]
MFAINGMPDHIHIAARFLPRHRFSDLLQVIKGNSSKWVNEQRKCRGHFQWQIGYGAFTVSKSRLDSVVRYIQNQEEHHKIKTFKEEFIELLEAHEIEYDERYLWD